MSYCIFTFVSPIALLDGLAGQARRNELVRLICLLAGWTGYDGDNPFTWYMHLVDYDPTPPPQVSYIRVPCIIKIDYLQMNDIFSHLSYNLNHLRIH
jgi:hypothetical protein